MNVVITTCRACKRETVLPGFNPFEDFSRYEPSSQVGVLCLLCGSGYSATFSECCLAPNSECAFDSIHKKNR